MVGTLKLAMCTNNIIYISSYIYTAGMYFSLRLSVITLYFQGVDMPSSNISISPFINYKGAVPVNTHYREITHYLTVNLSP